MKTEIFFIILLLIGILFYVLETATSTPMVYWSTSKNECVMVDIDGKKYSCDHLPKKYIKIWVK